MYYRPVTVFILWVCFCSVKSSPLIATPPPTGFGPCTNSPEPYKVPRIVKYNEPAPPGVDVKHVEGKIVIKASGGDQFGVGHLSQIDVCGKTGFTKYGLEVQGNAVFETLLVELVLDCGNANWEVTICMHLIDVGEDHEPQRTLNELVLDAYKGTGKSGKCKGCPKPCKKRHVAKDLKKNKVINGKTYKKGNYVSSKIEIGLGFPCDTVKLTNGEPFCLKMLYMKWEKGAPMPDVTGTLESGGTVTGDPTGQKLSGLEICYTGGELKEWIIILCAEKNPKPKDPPATDGEIDESADD